MRHHYALKRKKFRDFMKLIINVRINVITDIHNTKPIQPIKYALYVANVEIKVFVLKPVKMAIQLTMKRVIVIVINPLNAPRKSAGLNDICVHIQAANSRKIQKPILVILSKVKIVEIISNEAVKINAIFSSVREVG